MEGYEVLRPIGQPVGANAAPISARLDSLAGKTIAEVSNGKGFRTDWSFPIIREVLQKRYPDTRFIPFTEFPVFEPHALSPEAREEMWQTLKMSLKAKGCEAVIAQFAG